MFLMLNFTSNNLLVLNIYLKNNTDAYNSKHKLGIVS